MTRVEIQPTPVEHYTDLIRRRVPFALSRWGDGEWQSVLGRTHDDNSDGHHYFPDMGQALREVLTARPDYLLGMQPLAADLFGLEILTFLKAHGLTDLPWHDADVFHCANDGRNAAFCGFVDALRSRHLVVVGPGHLLGPLRLLLGYAVFIEVPLVDCWLSLDNVLDDLARALPVDAPAVVSVSFGMSAGVLIDRMARDHAGHAYLDMGAVWDPHCGMRSRSYMHREGWEPLRP